MFADNNTSMPKVYKKPPPPPKIKKYIFPSTNTQFDKLISLYSKTKKKILSNSWMFALCSMNRIKYVLDVINKFALDIFLDLAT